MSDTLFPATLRTSPRGFTRTLFVGALLVASALMLRGHHFGTAPRGGSVPRPAVVKVTRAPAAPSVFDVEAAMTPSQLLDRWDADVTKASKRFNVPKTWIRAVMARESGGRTMLTQDQPMVSSAGALGLMQVLPQTYADMRAQYGLGADPFDTHDNILAGAAYLRWLQGKYGYPAMFAAYNAGPGRLEDHIATGAVLPAETRAYVGGITRVLNPQGAGEFEVVKLTGPDGALLKINVNEVTAIRAALPGEYAATVKSVLISGRHSQGIREDVAAASAAIRASGGGLTRSLAGRATGAPVRAG